MKEEPTQKKFYKLLVTENNVIDVELLNREEKYPAIDFHQLLHYIKIKTNTLRNT